MAANYITPQGAKALTDELNRLISVERPKTVHDVATAAAHGDRSENAEYKYGKLRLKEIDRRMRFLNRRLDRAVVVDPETREATDVVFFGAVVELEDEEGVRTRYQLVGEDEIEPRQGRISWRSPLGRCLLKRKCGDIVCVRRPAGEMEFEILSVSYGVARLEE